MVNAMRDWKLVKFDLELESYFFTFSFQAIYFEWLYVAASFSL